MRALIVFSILLGSGEYSTAAEKAQARATAPVRLAQIAPDGFPLRFPEPPLAASPAKPPAEELPIPTTAAPLVLPPAPVPPSPSIPNLLPTRYPTHREFAATFRPAPGNYEVMLIHPYTHRPVKVCFSLPPGYVRHVAADRNELRFDYGGWELEVHFKRDGRIELDIDD